MLEKLSKYEIRIQIGRGAMGTVYEGFDTVIGRRVAVKTLRTELFDPAQLSSVLARFKREAQSAGQLSHPHIVTIHDYGEEAGTPYIVMEYLSGSELGHHLNQGSRFSLENVVGIMTQLLGALTHAHEHGVVHRDLKPANMFLLPDGSLKVVDFGIAQVEASDLTDTGAMLGTPAYMSPEQCLGTQVDHRTDVYSAGVILYQLLTGDKPFTGSVTTIIQKVLRQDPLPPSELNPTISTAWDKVVARAMAKKPEARFESARQFAEAIKAAFQAGRIQEEEARKKAAEADEHARRGAEERSRAEAQRRAEDERREAERIARAEAEARQAAEVRAKRESEARAIAESLERLRREDEHARAPKDDGAPIATSQSSVSLRKNKRSSVVATATTIAVVAIASVAAFLIYDRKVEPVPPVPVAQAPVAPEVATAAPSKEEIAKIGRETEERVKKETEERVRREYVAKAAAEQAAAKAAADKEKAAAEKVALVKVAAGKAAAEKAASEKAIADKAAAEKTTANRAAAEKEAKEKAEVERLAAEKAAAERVATEKAALSSAKQAGRSAIEANEAGNNYYRRQMHAEAVEQYRIAAEQNYAPAQNRLGDMYRNSWGVTRDYTEAMRWYRKAAEQSHADGQANVGSMYMGGWSVTRDHTEAMRWYRKAAEQNNMAAQFAIGLMHLNGLGVKQDDAEAVRWFRKAADQGLALGQFNLGNLYEDGRGGLGRNLEEAKKWYRKAAQQGNDLAKRNLQRLGNQ